MRPSFLSVGARVDDDGWAEVLVASPDTNGASDMSVVVATLGGTDFAVGLDFECLMFKDGLFATLDVEVVFESFALVVADHCFG
mgnify:CR=1 FL=1